MMSTLIAWAPRNLNVGAVMAPPGTKMTPQRHKELLISRLEALQVPPEELAELVERYLEDVPTSQQPTVAEIVETVADQGLLGLALALPQHPWPTPNKDNPKAKVFLERESRVKNPAARMEKWMAAVTAPLHSDE